MNLMEAILRRELRPKVVHRLPGRLRLRIPLLCRLRDSDVDVTAYLEDCLGLPAGIEAVSVDVRSGSILIRYHGDRLLEPDVLGYVESLLHLVAAHRHRIKDLHREDWERVGPKLKAVIAAATDQQLRVQAIEIPDDVWE